MEPLFAPFRALGYITDNIPYAVQRRGRESFVTVYNCEKLILVLVGPQLKHTIRALAVKGDLTFAATGCDIVESRRVHKSGVYVGHKGDVLQMMCLGSHLLSLGTDKRLLLWKFGEYEGPQVDIPLPEGFVPTCMAHPDTYLNKVVIGGADGRMLLYNFTTGRLLYEYEGLRGSAVRCIASSPALDIVGVGLSDGRALLHNLATDETLMTFSNASGAGTTSELYSNSANPTPAAGGACTTISFRTGSGVPLMAAGGSAGVVTVWNLEQRRLHTIIRDAHDAPLLALHFFPGEPRLMSAAGDNTLKQWLFDSADGTARLLRFRAGHSAPPTVVKYYGDGTRLLSAGQDRAFRLFSTIQDQQSRELTQKHTARRAKRLKVREEELKLPRVLDLAACQVRERDWCNVITAHEGETAAYTWLLKNYSLGEHALRPPPMDGVEPTPVTAVAISTCGNFGLVGTAGGRVDRYNMQSGIHRGDYCIESPAAPGKPSSSQGAHEGPVTGISVDACNRYLITSGWDGKLRSWDFNKRRVKGTLECGSTITRMCHHSDSALVAVACDDLLIRMYDIEAMTVVRRFRGHTDRITDLQTSQDGRWLLSSGMDGTVRVWDIPDSRIFQVMTLGSPVTSLSLSPSMDMMATTHANRRGIYLWSNQLIFGNGANIRPSKEPVRLRLPELRSGAADRDEERGNSEVEAEAEERETGAGVSSSDEDSDDEDSVERRRATAAARSAATAAAAAAEAEAGPPVYKQRDAAGAPQPLAPSLVTLSMLPRPQWQTLVHLDAIRSRSRPTQPAKKPEAAPFFLPTVAGVHRNPIFDVSAGAADGETDPAQQSRVISSRRGPQPEAPPFLRLLRAGAESGDFTSFAGHLRGLAPAAVDRELRSMQVLEGEDEEDSAEEVQDLCSFFDFIDSELIASRNFEFNQALLRAALRVHGDAIVAHSPLKERAARVEKRLQATWTRLDGLLQNVRCMVSFFGDLQA